MDYNKKEKEIKPAEPIIKSSGRTRKTPLHVKLTEAFIAEDINSVTDYLIWDVGVSLLKRSIVDAVDMIFNGKPGSYKSSSTPYVSYRDYAKQSSVASSSKPRNGARKYQNVVVDTRVEAKAILDEMKVRIHEYQFVTVADLYRMANIPSLGWTSENYGWTDISTAAIVRDRGGYMIILPTPEAL